MMSDYNRDDSTGNLSTISNQELTRLYELYDVGSVDFAAIRAEMVRRGFRFQDTPVREAGQEAEQTSRVWSGRGAKLSYAKGWSLFWEILFLVLGLAFFMAMMDASEWEPDLIIGLYLGFGVSMIISLGALISGARNLANHKSGSPEAVRSGLWQIILGVIWALLGTAVLVIGVIELLSLLEWNVEEIPYLIVTLITVAMVCAAFSITLITLGREMGSTG